MAQPPRTRAAGAALLLGAAWLLASVPSHALSLSPEAMELLQKPRKAAKGYFSVRNDGGEPVSVRTRSEPLFGLADGEEAARAVRFSPPEFTLAPGASRRVAVRVSPGGTGRERAFKVFFVAGRPGSGVSVALVGSVHAVPSAGVADLQASTLSVVRSAPSRWTLSATVRNTGDLRLFYGGSFSVQGPGAPSSARSARKAPEVLLPGQEAPMNWSWIPSPGAVPSHGLEAVFRVFYRSSGGEVRHLERRAPLKAGGSPAP